jgi:hypothetical protein
MPRPLSRGFWSKPPSNDLSRGQHDEQNLQRASHLSASPSRAFMAFSFTMRATANASAGSAARKCFFGFREPCSAQKPLKTLP